MAFVTLFPDGTLAFYQDEALQGAPLGARPPPARRQPFAPALYNYEHAFVVGGDAADRWWLCPDTPRVEGMARGAEQPAPIVDDNTSPPPLLHVLPDPVYLLHSKCIREKCAISPWAVVPVAGWRRVARRLRLRRVRRRVREAGRRHRRRHRRPRVAGRLHGRRHRRRPRLHRERAGRHRRPGGGGARPGAPVARRPCRRPCRRRPCCLALAALALPAFALALPTALARRRRQLERRFVRRTGWTRRPAASARRVDRRHDRRRPLDQGEPSASSGVATCSVGNSMRRSPRSASPGVASRLSRSTAARQRACAARAGRRRARPRPHARTAEACGEAARAARRRRRSERRPARQPARRPARRRRRRRPRSGPPRRRRRRPAAAARRAARGGRCARAPTPPRAAPAPPQSGARRASATAARCSNDDVFSRWRCIRPGSSSSATPRRSACWSSLRRCGGCCGGRAPALHHAALPQRAPGAVDGLARLLEEVVVAQQQLVGAVAQRKVGGGVAPPVARFFGLVPLHARERAAPLAAAGAAVLGERAAGAARRAGVLRLALAFVVAVVVAVGLGLRGDVVDGPLDIVSSWTFL